MTLRDKIQEDLKNALKAKDGTRVSVLRFLLASVKNREIDLKEALSDEQVLEEITSASKRRRESMEAFREGGRQDLVDKEEAELVILQEYLPEQLTPEEVRTLVQEVVDEMAAAGAADLGRVMKEVMPRVKGKADGKVVNQMVREILSD